MEEKKYLIQLMAATKLFWPIKNIEHALYNLIDVTQQRFIQNIYIVLATLNTHTWFDDLSDNNLDEYIEIYSDSLSGYLPSINNFDVKTETSSDMFARVDKLECIKAATHDLITVKKYIKKLKDSIILNEQHVLNSKRRILITTLYNFAVRTVSIYLSRWKNSLQYIEELKQENKEYKLNDLTLYILNRRLIPYTPEDITFYEEFSPPRDKFYYTINYPRNPIVVKPKFDVYSLYPFEIPSSASVVVNKSTAYEKSTKPSFDFFKKLENKNISSAASAPVSGASSISNTLIIDNLKSYILQLYTRAIEIKCSKIHDQARVLVSVYTFLEKNKVDNAWEGIKNVITLILPKVNNEIIIYNSKKSKELFTAALKNKKYIYERFMLPGTINFMISQINSRPDNFSSFDEFVRGRNIDNLFINNNLRYRESHLYYRMAIVIICIGNAYLKIIDRNNPEEINNPTIRFIQVYRPSFTLRHATIKCHFMTYLNIYFDLCRFFPNDITARLI
jgi:hypothetical protein